ncbi:DJ-1/PfpI family protein [Ereboglobus luteus]|uniref:DJ-1/PfpI domain-containing protein n=1 Tax=Ereboglobus luteus TaxID=1796921 RepID=A0A2U8E4J9_9BACT|nr:DJ-1/PfpI family protein [Ereboglobus luteus]AWI09797.1 hypothetical protein CKA38_11535 [Ereboglobus luteus]
MIKKTVLFVVLEQYADWEHAFLSTSLQHGINGKEPSCEVKVVSPGQGPIHSNGGFTTIPDYDIDNVPEDYAGLILVGGYSWFSESTGKLTEGAQRIIPLVEKAFAKGKVIGAICNGTVFLGMAGFLNVRKHTSNGIENLEKLAGSNYAGKANYRDAQAVRDGNLITANGTGFLEFSRECMLALDAYSGGDIEANYSFFKNGLCQ